VLAVQREDIVLDLDLDVLGLNLWGRWW